MNRSESSEFPPADSADSALRPPSIQRRRTLTAALRTVFFASLIVAACWSIQLGVRYRAWAWDYTQWIHFFPDVNNGYFWGSQAALPAERPRGYLNVYDYVANSASSRADDSPDYQLDYAPLRLLLMSKWVAWTRVTQPKQAAQVAMTSANGSRALAWDAKYDFFAFTLRFNLCLEIWGAIGIFLLSRHWMLRGAKMAQRRNLAAAAPINSRARRLMWWRRTTQVEAAPDPVAVPAIEGVSPPISKRERLLSWLDQPFSYRSWLLPLVAAWLFWFSPAVVISAHGWPTWDMWIIPFFIWTVYFASLDWWFVSGLVLAVGAMFKGQQLFVAPMFVLWPIFAGRPNKATRWLIGLTFGIALIALPWLVTYVPKAPPGTVIAPERVLDWPALLWVACIVAASIGLPMLLTRFRPWGVHSSLRSRWLVWGGLTVGGLLLVLWPFLSKENRPYFIAGWALAVTVVIAPQFLSIKRRLLIAAGAAGMSLLLCAVIFNGNFNWLYIGWGYGTRHYYRMTQGVSDNLAGLLHERYHWENIDETALTLDAHPVHLWPTSTVLLATPTNWSIREVLVGIYVVTFLLSVVGIALQYRRNDPRFLIAIATPWLMFFTFLPQIHERYLLYAAGVGSCMAVMSLGMSLMNVFLTLLTTVMTLHVMLHTAISNGYVHDFGNNVSPSFKFTLIQAIRRTYPDAAWAVMLCVGVFLYMSLTPSRKKSKPAAIVSATIVARAPTASIPSPETGPFLDPLPVEPLPSPEIDDPRAEPGMAS